MPLPNNPSTALTTTSTTPALSVTDPIRRQIENAGSPHVVTPPRPAGTSQSALVIASESRTSEADKKPKAAKLARGESRTPAYIIAKYGTRPGFRLVSAADACTRCR